MCENPTSPEHESLTESINTPETESDMKPELPLPTPDMSPIVRPEPIEMSMPQIPMSKTKLSVVVYKTQDIILELLINTAEIYLTQ